MFPVNRPGYERFLEVTSYTETLVMYCYVFMNRPRYERYPEVTSYIETRVM
jgi:hypothetical protein